MSASEKKSEIVSGSWLSDATTRFGYSDRCWRTTSLNRASSSSSCRKTIAAGPRVDSAILVVVVQMNTIVIRTGCIGFVGENLRLGISQYLSGIDKGEIESTLLSKDRRVMRTVEKMTRSRSRQLSGK